MQKSIRQDLDSQPCTVVWSDLALFYDSRKATRLCRSSIFVGAKFKKIGEFCRVRTSHAYQSFLSEGP